MNTEEHKTKEMMMGISIATLVACAELAKHFDLKEREVTDVFLKHFSNAIRDKEQLMNASKDMLEQLKNKLN